VKQKEEAKIQAKRVLESLKHTNKKNRNEVHKTRLSNCIEKFVKLEKETTEVNNVCLG